MPELTADITRPDIVYSDRMTLSLGDGQVELIHPGSNHSVDATVMNFPAERVAFATEFIVDAATGGGVLSWPAACGSVPGFDSAPLADWIDSIRTVEAIDFDILVPGHQWILLTPADVAEGRGLYESLVAEVSAGMSRGESLAELTRTLLFEDYRDWNGYDARRVRNIEAAYHNLRIYR
jgi:cyclase